MLDFDTALDLLNKYGYTSIQVHPFVYQDGDTIGICYTYVDEEYGLLERIKIFNNAEELEEFLKMYNWVQVNGKLHHVRMILDNYESINPKVMFLRNEKIMVEGEMFDIESYDNRESMRVNMDPVSKVIYECGDLLLVYNEIKNRQLQYLKNIIKLKNSLRHKYFDLQAEVDKYNKVKVERNLTLLPEITDSGINEMLEMSTKDKYNSYIAQRPDYDEALGFLKEVWELCLGLELNSKYYEAQKEENDIRNEMKVVDQKLTLMRTLNEDLKPLFGIDLVSRFRKINRVCKAESTTISNDFITQQMDAVNRKYSFFDKLDSLYTSDYLREAIQNSNYPDLAIKYAPGANFDVVSKFKTPLNEVASSLSIQYRDKLSSEEQAILVLYNNPKYKAICDTILNLENFETLPTKNILKAVNAIKGFSKIKSECYESVKKRLDDPINQKIKNSLFVNIDFTTFETFIASIVKKLSLLRTINEKMVLNGDINMYIYVDKVEDLEKKKFVMTTNDLQGIIAVVKDSKKMVGITLLKEGTPVLYSPYYFDVGDIYSKGASLEMYIKEMVNFELLIDISDITINIDPNRTIVAKYFSTPNIVENLSIVDDIKMSYKTIFCKYALTSKLSTVVTMNQAQAVASSVSPVVNSAFDAGMLAAVSSTEPTTELVTEPLTEVVTEPLTEPVTEVITEPLTEPSTEIITDPLTEPSTEMVTEPDTENFAEPTTEVVVNIVGEENVKGNNEITGLIKKTEVTSEPSIEAKEVSSEPKLTDKKDVTVVKPAEASKVTQGSSVSANVKKEGVELPNSIDAAQKNVATLKVEPLKKEVVSSAVQTAKVVKNDEKVLTKTNLNSAANVKPVEKQIPQASPVVKKVVVSQPTTNVLSNTQVKTTQTSVVENVVEKKVEVVNQSQQPKIVNELPKAIVNSVVNIEKKVKEGENDV